MTATRQSLADGAIRTAAELPSRAEPELWAVPPGDLAESARSVLAALWLWPSRSEMGLLNGLQVGELVVLTSADRQWRTGTLQPTPPATKALVGVALRARDLLSKVR